MSFIPIFIVAFRPEEMHLVEKCYIINAVFFLLSCKRNKNNFADPSGSADNTLQTTGQDQDYRKTVQLDTTSSPTKCAVLLSHSMQNLCH
jgi:hypothetical protein